MAPSPRWSTALCWGLRGIDRSIPTILRRTYRRLGYRSAWYPVEVPIRLLTAFTEPQMCKQRLYISSLATAPALTSPRFTMTTRCSGYTQVCSVTVTWATWYGTARSSGGWVPRDTIIRVSISYICLKWNKGSFVRSCVVLCVNR